MLTLDCQALKCPLPLLKLKVALNDLAPGEAVELWATDPISCRDIPAFCQKTGHRLLSQSEGPVFRFVIEKGGPLVARL